jgi:hypothetical protein
MQTPYRTLYRTPRFCAKYPFDFNDLKITQVLKILVSVVRFRPRAPQKQALIRGTFSQSANTSRVTRLDAQTAIIGDTRVT